MVIYIGCDYSVIIIFLYSNVFFFFDVFFFDIPHTKID